MRRHPICAYRSGMLNGMATTQIAIRLDDHVLAAVDQLVSTGGGESRADVVRQALKVLFQAQEKERIDRLMVDGYSRTPSTLTEDAAAEASLRDAIGEEPW